ncbi:hypothetical protein [Streptomyces sp. NPDC048639]|uniref:hypothetical protein n=1 Tax=Streptomyces sp. NPDC048639 TaxID=3365581 RepID=UPI00371675CF
MQRIATATLVALAAGGMVTLGPGTAFADGHGHGHGRGDGHGHSRGHGHGEGPGASAAGGGSLVGSAFQQNTAQEARQNNHCSDPNPFDQVVSISGGRAEGHCKTKDNSVNHDARVKKGGAEALGGSSATALVQQNTAQQGRQNNNCANPNASGLDLSGGRVEAWCADEDESVNKHTRYKGGGASAYGGSSLGADLFSQNTAQEGRQNNNCANPNEAGLEVTGGSLEAHCRNKDGSFNKHTKTVSGGAEANGGGTVGEISQQNTAQEGRQNINCANPQATEIELVGGRVDASCENEDKSFNHKTFTKGEGARANGGSAGVTELASLNQQNVAQEGRQNINCANPNEVEAELIGGRDSTRCWHKDKSFNHKTVTKGGGAEANGGYGVADVGQQNIAQEGRQNSNCGNANGLDLEVSGGRRDVECGAVDASTNVRTKEIGGGAEADGGGGAVNLFQQNVAQEGRQNNNCGNPNNLALTVSGGRSSTQCLAVDRSVNIDSVYR